MTLWKNNKITPMLLKEIDKPFSSSDYIYEIKFDGVRALIFVSPSYIKVQSRNKEDLTYLFPELQSLKKLVNCNVIFDGEIVSFNNLGKPSFQKLQERTHLKNKLKIKNKTKETPVTFMCFDIIYERKSLTNLTLLERKKILNKYKDTSVFIKTKYISENGKELFKLVKKENLEGIIAKKKNSLYYLNERKDDWIKIKNLKKGVFIIGGYSEKKENYVISLSLGEYQNNKFTFVGKVSLPKKNNLYKKIKELSTIKTSPFINYNEEINYIKPTLKCNIKYLERTKNNHLRQPIFINEKTAK